MHNCIFTAHCIEDICDKSCPILAETSYLLERNNIYDSPSTFNCSADEISKFNRVLSEGEGIISTYVTNDVITDTSKLTYVAICNNWKNSQLHCTVFNLRYSQYLDELKRSWGTHSESEILEYMRIWVSSSKILIISHFDYVNFGDFESQTLLLLLQERQSKRQTTILVSPRIESLVSTKVSAFFNSLKSKLTASVKVVSL